MPANQVPPIIPLTGTSEEPISNPPERMGPGVPRPPRPGGMAQTRPGTGQGAAAQMGTPICLQQPGPEWNHLN